jgi:hypothetical protein
MTPEATVSFDNTREGDCLAFDALAQVRLFSLIYHSSRWVHKGQMTG